MLVCIAACLMMAVLGRLFGLALYDEAANLAAAIDGGVDGLQFQR
jgi:hypothetical protein